MPLNVTILGCGSSGGVPRVGGDWGVCDPDEPKNRRRRCSILVDYWDKGDIPHPKDRTRILVDTAPDLREQMIDANVKHLDALLFTHEHADQTHGIDDIRAVAYRMRTKLPTYMDEHTKTHLLQKFSYCFEMPEGRVHPAILDLQPLVSSGDMIDISGPGGAVSVKALGLSHGPTPVLGFIFDGKMAYSPDVWDISDDMLDELSEMDVWIVDALRYNQHPTHAHADKCLSWIARTRTRKAVLTNLHIDMDYKTLSDELSGTHKAAYDGMEVTISTV